ncbi:hypothetical protein TNCV_1946561 [Trichonephila clavipes]|uniref:Uncharacterized protein n=1 Tax=Trichonephila clavipes TaxID=2585209 RepID=A0A8X6SDA1_TRICX|nr:hypothetical protein TNCV_1946561 [Trichonephila clavipes]
MTTSNMIGVYETFRSALLALEELSWICTLLSTIVVIRIRRGILQTGVDKFLGMISAYLKFSPTRSYEDVSGDRLR